MNTVEKAITSVMRRFSSDDDDDEQQVVDVQVVSKPEDVPKEPIHGKPTVVDWNILGSVQAVRLSLVSAGVKFVDIRIDPGERSSEEYKQTWIQAQASLEDVLLFTNLPYFLDGQVALSHPDSILKHIARTYDLMGEAGQEHIIDQTLEELHDLERTLLTLYHIEGRKVAADWCRIMAPMKLAKWQRFLGQKPFLTGMSLSVADLKLYVFLFKLQAVERDGIPDWTPYMKRIENLPKIKAYMSSPHYMLRPASEFTSESCQ